MHNALSPEECSLKETSRHLGFGGRERLTPKYDLVEQMLFIYVRAVRAKDLPCNDGNENCNYYVEAKVGNFRRITRHLDDKASLEWNQVFTFSKDLNHASILEVAVKNKDCTKEETAGVVLFDLNEIPDRVPPDSPLAPQWYKLEDRHGNNVGEVMLAVWIGTQADEAFPEAWHFDIASISDGGLVNLRSKVYVSPKLWYVRVNVIEVLDLQPSDKTRFPEVFVKVVLGNQALRTKISQNRAMNHMWNEDLMFVVAEPFEDQVVITVEDKVGPNNDVLMGKVAISLQNVEKRLDCKTMKSKWYDLEKIEANDHSQKKKKKKELNLSTRIHLRICLDGGYHVLDESTNYSSDLRPTAKQLWEPSIGVLELGILGAQGLTPMMTKGGEGTTNAYCVAKYGQKWIRTRTVVDSFTPKWNEQYTWEVFEPCTVITIGVFNNCQLQGGEKMAITRDSVIGKVRIRLSTLESDKVYIHSYPLIVMNRSGLKKMGELQLALRFTCLSLLSMLNGYLKPLLPKMHYLHPLSVAQLNMLRHHSMQIVSMRLGRAEPPLRREVVEYMLYVGSHMWSMRKSKVNFFRIIGSLKDLIAAVKWFNSICNWKFPVLTVMIHILVAIFALFPELILPSFFLNLFFIGIWKYRWKPRHPPYMDTQLSLADVVPCDELGEEFDTFPTSEPSQIVKQRYDRLRSVAGRIQMVIGDLAVQGERIQSLLSWRDPRATAVFLIFCLIAAIVLYVIPMRVVALLTGFYILRHPSLRQEVPSVFFNFFRRLPAKPDCLL
ncbi:hypothetical protein KFK09_007017 [Dendrobium nobile]|uniref:C2 domain-containing protein n=1 Tax=Dendrobium nobile TaxID=94219 RepID=A0A8T3BU03_DENNO|nr:hypothetical protein KFK09_007017 [Dendrobium nobile]